MDTAPENTQDFSRTKHAEQDVYEISCTNLSNMPSAFLSLSDLE
jgi:hypothetical protein